MRSLVRAGLDVRKITQDEISQADYATAHAEVIILLPFVRTARDAERCSGLRASTVLQLPDGVQPRKDGLWHDCCSLT